MKRIALAVALSCATFSSAVAADQTCKSQADTKKTCGCRPNQLHEEMRVRCSDRLRQAGRGQEIIGCRQGQFHQEMREGCNWRIASFVGTQIE